MSIQSLVNRSTREILSLTGIRGMAAVGVLLAHINVDLEKDYLYPKLIYAQLFVDFFFILSGFVISYVYINKAEWTRAFYYKFYSARFARIYPLYIFALGVAVVLKYSKVLHIHQLPGGGMGSAISQVLLLSAMPGVALKKFLVFTSWSISIEWWVYIFVFPVLVALRKYRSYLSSPVVISLISIILAFYLYNLSGDVRFTRGWPAWIRGVSGFSLGWIIHYHYINKTKLSEWCGKNVNLLLILWTGILLILPQFHDSQPWVGIIISPYLLLGLCRPDTTSSKLMSSKTMVYLGDISYSIYLLHPLVLSVLKNWLPYLAVSDTVICILHFLLGTSITLGVSAMSYRYLERPCRDWVQKRLILKKAK